MTQVAVTSGVRHMTQVAVTLRVRHMTQVAVTLRRETHDTSGCDVKA